MAAELQKQFGETAFATGVAEGAAVKFYGNPATGTWSVVIITPYGAGCMVAAGEALEFEGAHTTALPMQARQP